jgi:NMD protein affecting ribosome stability and mRNA decay
LKKFFQFLVRVNIFFYKPGDVMSTENKSSRRIFLMQVATSGLALIAVSNAQAQAMVVETDAQASSLGYKADATKVDKAKQPKYAAGQLCSNCALFQGAAIFAGKQVAAKGWCSAYAKKA